ncbi:tryptophan 7-halogenase [Caulobacter sp. 1776]|uniref:tryptophan 7-halogenase n=1 Tax=Caulobacter sp. 1776 TaxID=3156420 RepID=UPI00339938F6
MTGGPDKVVVVGRDAPLWLSAAVLRVALEPAGVAVTAVELPSRLTSASVHATLPALEALHVQLGLDESALLRMVGGTFSLGGNFTDLAGKAPAFFHAHGTHGASIDGRDFFAYWLKARELGLNAEFADFSLTAAAARHGRFVLQDDEIEIFGRCEYGYHLPAQAYAGVLKSLAVRRGVETYRSVSVSAEHGEGGDVIALNLDEDRRVVGDLFIDTTAEALLIGGALGVGRESWREVFPADRVLTAVAPAFASIPAYGEVRAWARGWTALHPTQNRAHIVQAYAGDLCTDEEALQAASAASGLPLKDASVAISDPGRRLSAWARNVVAIGEAACAFDPLHGVELHAVQVGLVQLLGLFPVSAEWRFERGAYNRAMRERFERVRDFQQLHHVLNRYGVSDFWSLARQATPSPDLAHMIALFRARGDIAPFEHQSFPDDSWRALFVGHGVTPDSHAPLIDTTAPELIKHEFRRILSFIKSQVERQPTHDLYLESFCGRTPPEVALG